ncbi:MAG: sigma-70 family RNA polymerase sigma factor [Planctomycetales bacterium]|nr:sigma-70 family RNA polymerase sigma factor [Planctomycetales bacterium]
MSLLTSNQRALRGYIFTLVPHAADAEEIIQQTNIVLWRKFDEFTPGSSFLAWATRVAYFEVLGFRRQQRKDILYFSDEELEMLSDDVTSMHDELQEQCDSLAACIGKLSEKDRTLVSMRYDERRSVKSVASTLGRSADGVYKSLQRIRRSLLQCVQRKSSEG